MTKETVFEVLNEVFYGSVRYTSVIIYAGFQTMRLVTDSEGKFPAFELTSQLLKIEYPTRADWVSLDAITFISACED